MESSEAKLKNLGKILLEIGAMLMSSGASTARVRNTLNRISETFSCHAEVFITHRALMLTVNDEKDHHHFSSMKRTSAHGVNFKLVSGISRMSWRVAEEKWEIEEIRKELDRLLALPHYPRWVVLIFIGLSGASFCRLFGGQTIEMLFTFVGTLAGLVVRQETMKRSFNPYLCVYFASLTASLVAGSAIHFEIGVSPEIAFSACVLFLIPGVPLINMFSDLIDGNLMNGIIRGINGLLISFAIALGLLSAMIIYQI